MKKTILNVTDLRKQKTPPERLPSFAGVVDGPYTDEAYQKELEGVMTPIEKREWDRHKNAPSEMLVKLCNAVLEIEGTDALKNQVAKIFEEHQSDLIKMDDYQKELVLNFVKSLQGERMGIYEKLMGIMQEFTFPDWPYY